MLYSTITKVALFVNQRYYGDRHYLWCTPNFRSNSDAVDFTVPPTSSPFDIYATLEKEVRGMDSHSEKIKLNRTGIVHGAQIMRQRMIISVAQKNQIEIIARDAPIAAFKPFLCVISSHDARSYCTEVDISRTANMFSQEYIAVDLPRLAFDVISLE